MDHGKKNKDTHDDMTDHGKEKIRTHMTTKSGVCGSVSEPIPGSQNKG